MGQIVMEHCMDSKLWTFNPVYPEAYDTVQPKVMAVGDEPNDNGSRPDRDMGLWFRTAAAHHYWENRIFYDATLRHIRAVLSPRLTDQGDDVILRHVRQVDLKATGGGGRAKKREVAEWVRRHLKHVVSYWVKDRPAFVILQGNIACEVFEEIVVPALYIEKVECLKVGLLHPSRQNHQHLNDPAYLAALNKVHEQLRPLEEPLLRWDAYNKQWLQWSPHGKSWWPTSV